MRLGLVWLGHRLEALALAVARIYRVEGLAARRG